MDAIVDDLRHDGAQRERTDEEKAAGAAGIRARIQYLRSRCSDPAAIDAELAADPRLLMGGPAGLSRVEALTPRPPSSSRRARSSSPSGATAPRSRCGEVLEFRRLVGGFLALEIEELRVLSVALVVAREGIFKLMINVNCF